VPCRALFALIAGVAETETEATTSGWLSKIKQTELSGQTNTHSRAFGRTCQDARDGRDGRMHTAMAAFSEQ